MWEWEDVTTYFKEIGLETVDCIHPAPNNEKLL